MSRESSTPKVSGKTGASISQNLPGESGRIRSGSRKASLEGRLFKIHVVPAEADGVTESYFAMGQELAEQAPVEQGDGAAGADAGLPLP